MACDLGRVVARVRAVMGMAVKPRLGRGGSAAAQKAVLVALAMLADDAGVSWPSLSHLSEASGVQVDALRGTLATLETAGLVRREARWSRVGRRTSDRFVLVDAAIARAPRVAEEDGDESLVEVVEPGRGAGGDPLHGAGGDPLRGAGGHFIESQKNTDDAGACAACSGGEDRAADVGCGSGALAGGAPGTERAEGDGARDRAPWAGVLSAWEAWSGTRLGAGWHGPAGDFARAYAAGPVLGLTAAEFALRVVATARASGARIGTPRAAAAYCRAALERCRAEGTTPEDRGRAGRPAGSRLAGGPPAVAMRAWRRSDGAGRPGSGASGRLSGAAALACLDAILARGRTGAGVGTGAGVAGGAVAGAGVGL